MSTFERLKKSIFAPGATKISEKPSIKLITIKNGYNIMKLGSKTKKNMFGREVEVSYSTVNISNFPKPIVEINQNYRKYIELVLTEETKAVFKFIHFFNEKFKKRTFNVNTYYGNGYSTDYSEENPVEFMKKKMLDIDYYFNENPTTSKMNNIWKGTRMIQHNFNKHKIEIKATKFITNTNKTKTRNESQLIFQGNVGKQTNNIMIGLKEKLNKKRKFFYYVFVLQKFLKLTATQQPLIEGLNNNKIMQQLNSIITELFAEIGNSNNLYFNLANSNIIILYNRIIRTPTDNKFATLLSIGEAQRDKLLEILLITLTKKCINEIRIINSGYRFYSPVADLLINKYVNSLLTITVQKYKNRRTVTNTRNLKEKLLSFLVEANQEIINERETTDQLAFDNIKYWLEIALKFRTLDNRTNIITIKDLIDDLNNVKKNNNHINLKPQVNNTVRPDMLNEILNVIKKFIVKGIIGDQLTALVTAAPDTDAATAATAATATAANKHVVAATAPNINILKAIVKTKNNNIIFTNNINTLIRNQNDENIKYFLEKIKIEEAKAVAETQRPPSGPTPANASTQEESGSNNGQVRGEVSVIGPGIDQIDGGSKKPVKKTTTKKTTTTKKPVKKTITKKTTTTKKPAKKPTTTKKTTTTKKPAKKPTTTKKSTTTKKPVKKTTTTKKSTSTKNPAKKPTTTKKTTTKKKTTSKK